MSLGVAAVQGQQKAKKLKAAGASKAAGDVNARDARNTPREQTLQARDPEFAKYGIFEQSAPRRHRRRRSIHRCRWS